MVQTETSQLSSECSEWRQILRNYRDEFHDYEKLLRDTCKPDLAKVHLTHVEHFQNQFDIQLKNIHDVKLQIKTHERKVQMQSSEAENLQNGTYEEHERLLSEFLSLESTLQEIRNDFKNFISKVSC